MQYKVLNLELIRWKGITNKNTESLLNRFDL